MAEVVLLSGGIDSLVCAEMARAEGRLVGCVFVDYGHPSQIQEGWKAFAYCGSRGIPLRAPHVRDLDLGDMAGEGRAARVVPYRNAALLAVAANAAAGWLHNPTGRLVIGCNAADQRDYVDCRPAFLDSMGAALGVQIEAPLLHLEKGEIIARAIALGLSPDDAWSCYGAGPDPCGECPSCLESIGAWADGP